MVFVAILIPVAVEGLQISNRAGVLAHRKRAAACLAERLLTEMIVTEEWRDGDDEGDFGEDAPGYRWILESAAWESEPWEESTMRTLSVEVFFNVQEREHSVRLSTLVEEAEEE